MRTLRKPILVTLLVIAICYHQSAMSQSKLSPEGQERKAAHEFLLGKFSEGKQVKTSSKGEQAVFQEIVLSSDPIEAKGEVTIRLPEGSQRVASMFRYLLIRGEGLDNLESLVMVPYDKTGSMAVSTQEPTIYRVKVPAMPMPSGSMPPIQIETRCKPGTTAKITEIAFNSQGKLPLKFDDIPYRNLGAEFPRKQINISIDLKQELSIAGHIDLERDKYCRYYAAPGRVDKSFEKWAAERNFLPGRQMVKFQPSLVVGYSKNQPTLKESKTKKGAADLSFFDTYNNRAGVADTIEPFRKIKYAMCINDYPEFMSVEKIGRGTPLVEHFDDAAELAAAYIADQIKDTGRTATYWEVKNESTIKSEWSYHWNPNAWDLLADFHNKVADAVHEKGLDTQIGGPSSAWMQLQIKDFQLYRSQRGFMDATKDHLDYYSHHFYEDIGTLGAWERRQGKYTNYLLGRLEAIMNMFQAHMHGTDNVKPILITECGSLQAGRGPSDYWLRLRSFSAYMHKFMQRPQEVELVVPFAFMTLPWNPQSGDASFTPKEGVSNWATLDQCDPTPVAHFFELWKDFDGRRLDFSITDPNFEIANGSDIQPQWLDITAVHKGSRVQVAITNMGGRQLNLNFESLLNKKSVKSATQRRLYYQNGEIIYQEGLSVAVDSVPIDVEETTIITFELDQPIGVKSTVNRQFWYASETAVKTQADRKAKFEIALPNLESIESAKLVVGIHRAGGVAGGLKGEINGKKWEASAKWAKEFNHLFAPVEILVPLEDLAASNAVKIAGQDGLTITSVHIVTESKTAPQ